MANDFKKNVGGPISKQEALKWIDKYDKERKKDTKSVFFGKDVFDQIFQDPRATGISFFFARKNDGKKDADDLIMVPTTEDGTLLWTDNPPEANAKTLDSGSSTYDSAYLCPPYCPK